MRVSRLFILFIIVTLGLTACSDSKSDGPAPESLVGTTWVYTDTWNEENGKNWEEWTLTFVNGTEYKIVEKYGWPGYENSDEREGLYVYNDSKVKLTPEFDERGTVTGSKITFVERYSDGDTETFVFKKKN